MNDDELLARLKAADPALAARAPLPDVDRLVEAVSHTGTTLRPERDATGVPALPAKTATRRRRHPLALAAAVGALLLGGGITGGLMANHGSGTSPSAGPLRLTVTSGSAGAKCAAPVPDRFRQYPLLFEGTVTSVSGSSASFRVDHWLQGGAGAGTARLTSDTHVPERLAFSVGEHYIVAADADGTVPACGANGVTDATADKFRQAYGN
ncbi:hypothetical protein [Streptomyces sp. GbtcB6]|uniref:hypothetical protein n=1 Tax=Streptomyces sp. GbtcB6 TaxID=2824751 RepID=UPI001C2FABF9|nr:hypothetical protein [Streptomyces sp. GbtcB6]